MSSLSTNTRAEALNPAVPRPIHAGSGPVRPSVDNDGEHIQVADYPAYRLCVAPMMDCTDRHDRMLLRQCSQHALLYTEMLTAKALIHGDREYLLGFHPEEHPVALQIGGSEPEEMAAAAQIGASFGYDEINMNVGCPSDRVQSGRFGACLMKEPQRVADCVDAMSAAVSIPVTVKCRTGVDDTDSYEHLQHFVEVVSGAGCERFIIHARKAWLSGLSPRQNREIPPLRYDVVGRLQAQFPELTLVLNGGIISMDDVEEHLATFPGVMVGREVYRNPYFLALADQRIFNASRPVPTRHDVVHRLLPYVERQLSSGTRLSAISRHMVGLFQGQPGAKRWRRHISEQAHRKGAGIEVLTDALALTGPTTSASPALANQAG